MEGLRNEKEKEEKVKKDKKNSEGGNQEEEDVKTGEKDIFAPKNKITRSPFATGKKSKITHVEENPARTRSWSLSDTSKRTRDANSEDELNDYVEMMNKIKKTSEELYRLVTENPNTKMEIKNTVKALRWQVDSMSRTTKNWEEIPRSKRTKTSKEDVRPTVICSRCNRDIAEGHKEEVVLEKDLTEDINSMLLTMSVGSFEKVIDMEWPQTCYKVTELKDYTASNIAGNGSLAVVLDPKSKADDKALAMLVREFSVAKTLIDEGLTEGQIESIKIHAEVTSSKSDRKCNQYSNTIYTLPVRITEGAFEDVEDILKICQKLKAEVKEADLVGIKFVLAGPYSTDYFRKCAEFTFHDCGYKVTIICKINKSQEKKVKGSPRKLNLRR